MTLFSVLRVTSTSFPLPRLSMTLPFVVPTHDPLSTSPSHPPPSSLCLESVGRSPRESPSRTPPDSARHLLTSYACHVVPPRYVRVCVRVCMCADLLHTRFQPPIVHSEHTPDPCRTLTSVPDTEPRLPRLIRRKRGVALRRKRLPSPSSRPYGLW